MSSTMDLNDAADTAELKTEVLKMLNEAPDGLASDDIFSRSQLAQERSELSRTLGNLRSSKNVNVREEGGRRTFFISEKGRSMLLAGVAPEVEPERIPIEEAMPAAVPAAPAAAAKKAAAKPGKLVMVPVKTVQNFRCMLTSDSSLIIEKQAGEKIEIEPDQVAVLWDYLARIYPALVKTE